MYIHTYIRASGYNTRGAPLEASDVMGGGHAQRGLRVLLDANQVEIERCFQLRVPLVITPRDVYLHAQQPRTFIYAYIYTSIHLYMHIHTHTYIMLYVYIYYNIHTCMCVCVCLYIYLANLHAMIYVYI